VDLFEAIHTRRSVRSFLDRPVAEEQLTELLRAAMAAPSAGNARPWRFVVIDERGLLDRIPTLHPHASMCAQAPMAILVCGDPALERYPGNWVLDCAAATENLLLAARGLGLGAVWTGVYPSQERMDRLAELLHLPATLRPHTLIPLGHSEQAQGSADRYDPTRVRRNLGWALE